MASRGGRPQRFRATPTGKVHQAGGLKFPAGRMILVGLCGAEVARRKDVLCPSEAVTCASCKKKLPKS